MAQSTYAVWNPEFKIYWENPILDEVQNNHSSWIAEEIFQFYLDNSSNWLAFLSWLLHILTEINK